MDTSSLIGGFVHRVWTTLGTSGGPPTSGGGSGFGIWQLDGGEPLRTVTPRCPRPFERGPRPAQHLVGTQAVVGIGRDRSTHRSEPGARRRGTDLDSFGDPDPAGLGGVLADDSDR